MAFPSTPILDNFNRADENPVAGGWAGQVFDPGGARMKIVSNQLLPVADFGGAYWNTLIHGDCEVYGTCVTSATPLIGLRLRNPNTASFSGYKLVSSAGAGKIIRIDNGAETVLGAAFGTISSGDIVGLTIRGTILEAWKNGASLGQRSDATYGAPGYVFCGTDGAAAGGQAWDDFGGGTISDPWTPRGAGMGVVL